MNRSIWPGAVVFCLLISTGAAWANCPAGYLDEIFCDDFDTYCADTPGFPGDPKCLAGAGKSDVYLRYVWNRSTSDECGTEFNVETETRFLTSGPFGARYPCGGEDQLGQESVRDWVHSPYPASGEGQILTISWLIQQTFNNPQCTAVVGTDDRPLVMEFLLNGLTAGKIDWGNGYMELALDDDGDPTTVGRFERANTSFVLSPDCNTYCDPPIANEPMPIICAQGNPQAGMPDGCPDVVAYPPPVHQSIAVGVLGLMDTNPCHCGSEEVHGPVNNHLNVFDGRKWWMLRSGSPRPSTGWVTLKNSPTHLEPPYPAGIGAPGHFDLSGAENGGKSYNWVTLTIKTSTFDVQLRTQEKGTDNEDYNVYSVMEDIPREYLGPFNAIRSGVGEGRELASNTSWSSFTGNLKCLRSRVPDGHAGGLVYDDFVLHGGACNRQEGACCTADGGCVDDLLAEDCTAIGGSPRGPSTTCGTLAQMCCPQLYGDSDGDGDVDMTDFGVLQACITTGLGGPGQVTDDACKCLDKESDNVIGEVEVERFIGCASGPDMAGTSTSPCNGSGW